MVIVLFEVVIKEGKMTQYLDMAATLKEELTKAKGLIRTERFSSLAQEGKLLSLSIWESETAVTMWRNQMAHRYSQKTGRDALFEDYKITVVAPIRTYTLDSREQAPTDSNIFFQL